MKLKKILYPTDFSEHSLCALPYARDLAGQFGAELHCLHVVDESYQYWLGPGETAVPVVFPMDDIIKSVQKQMDDLVKKHFGDLGNQVIASVVSGRPFVEIIRYAREHDIDLTVIATHGHGALASMFLGSVTEKVVRKSDCPVLTVRHPEYKYKAP